MKRLSQILGTILLIVVAFGVVSVALDKLGAESDKIQADRKRAEAEREAYFKQRAADERLVSSREVPLHERAERIRSECRARGTEC